MESKDKTGDQYLKIAPYYEMVIGRALFDLRRNIRTFINYQNHKKIIDVCCGTGRQLEMLSASDMKLFGVDMSKSMINEANHDLGIKYKVINATKIDYPRESFDAVILSFALHEKNAEVGDTIAQICWNLVRPGGHLIIADFCHISKTLAGKFWGSCFIPLIEMAAGKEHYQHYTSWMKNGALESLIVDFQGKKRIISQHFGKAVTVYSVEKNRYPKDLFLSLNSISP